MLGTCRLKCYQLDAPVLAFESVCTLLCASVVHMPPHCIHMQVLLFLSLVVLCLALLRLSLLLLHEPLDSQSLNNI
jgi:hypothetical protein